MPETPPTPPVSAAGNTQGNFINRGYAAIQGDWIYYGTFDGLYKMRTDGTGRTKLADVYIGAIRGINIVGDWVYFRDVHLGDMIIYRIRTDGTNKSVVGRQVTVPESGSSVGDLHSLIVDGWSYGLDLWQYRIFRTPLDDGSSSELIVSCGHMCLDLAGVIGDTVYYLHTNHDNYLLELYKIVIGETEGTLVAVDVDCRRPVIDGDWVYYVDSNYDFYKVRTDGTGKTMLYARANAVGVGSFNVSDGWIYFSTTMLRNNDPSTGLMKMRTDGTGVTKLHHGFADDINIAGDWIFFNLEYDRLSYKIRTDGTGFQIT
jgi:hypothetical protein